MKIWFGESGPTRVAHDDSLTFLAVDGQPQGVALRWKKGNRYTFKTSNHSSGKQDHLQAEGEVMFGVQPLAHLFVSYTENDEDPLSISLERIAFTREHENEVEWRDVIYVAEAASDAVKIDESFEQTQLPFVGKVKIKTTLSKTAEGNEGAEEANGTE